MRLNQIAPRILVVDDTPDNRRLLTFMLRDAGYNTLEAVDGAEALQLATDADLVLLDVVMPGLDGFAVCERLRKRHETQFLPVVMLTGLDSLSDRIAGKKAGADDFISKPFDRRELLTRVGSLLRMKAQRAEIELLRAELVAMVVNDLQAPLQDMINTGLHLGQALPTEARHALSLHIVAQGRLMLERVSRLMNAERLAAQLTNLEDPMDPSALSA